MVSSAKGVHVDGSATELEAVDELATSPRIRVVADSFHKGSIDLRERWDGQCLYVLVFAHAVQQPQKNKGMQRRHFWICVLHADYLFLRNLLIPTLQYVKAHVIQGVILGISMSERHGVDLRKARSRRFRKDRQEALSGFLAEKSDFSARARSTCVRLQVTVMTFLRHLGLPEKRPGSLMPRAVTS